ncbi:hypothetical protein PMAYCL1PPCAC_13811, partial [Pristionchus mayeri]
CTANDIKEEPVEFKDEHIDFIDDVQPFETPREIKEESVEIKDDPIDDFSDINQEDPITDMYYPSTGTARPINQFTPRMNCYVSSKTTSAKKLGISSGITWRGIHSHQRIKSLNINRIHFSKMQ